MNVSRNLVRVCRLGARNMTTSCPAKPKHDVVDLTKLKKKQALFQIDNNLPVFLKGGPSDLLLYRATMLVTLAGLAGICDLMYTLCYKQ